MMRISFRSQGGGPKRRHSIEPWNAGVERPSGETVRRLDESADLVMLSAPRSVPAEIFRRLENQIVNEYDRMQVIVVTSGTPSEGKSIVAANLALAFAAGNRSETLLLDADLRKPSLGRRLDPEPVFGLAEIVSGRCTLEEAVLSLENSPLKVLPAGSSVSDPLGMLWSEAARDLMSTLKSRFRRIIIDTPPVLLFTDADAVGALGDGILMVVRSRQTLVNEYTQALSIISSAPILGTVLNDACSNLADSQRFYARYHEYYEDGSER